MAKKTAEEPAGGVKKPFKLFISSDIEGTAGITDWKETDGRDGAWTAYFRKQMTREVAAACEGALAAGVTDILVKDAHDTARNIDPGGLPRSVCINRGWSGNPFMMVAGLSRDFNAAAFTGYHSPGCGAGNPLSHSMATGTDVITINGVRASEFVICAYAAGMMQVPVVFLSGDAALCEQAREFVPGIVAVAVSHGSGGASTSSHPDDAVDMIRQGMEKALREKAAGCTVRLPRHFDVRVRYNAHSKAYRMAFYPGARQLDEKTVIFEHQDYNEVLRFFHFVL